MLINVCADAGEEEAEEVCASRGYSERLLPPEAHPVGIGLRPKSAFGSRARKDLCPEGGHTCHSSGSTASTQVSQDGTQG